MTRRTFRDPALTVSPVGKYKRYNLMPDYGSDVSLNVYQTGHCFLHVGEACIILTREQVCDLLVDAAGLWYKR